MKIFIWSYLPNVSDSYHPEGGFVAIAENLEQAKKLLPYPIDSEPDFVDDLANTKHLQKFIFPNAGCC